MELILFTKLDFYGPNTFEVYCNIQEPLYHVVIVDLDNVPWPRKGGNLLWP